jgi:hypothetical protein
MMLVPMTFLALLQAGTPTNTAKPDPLNAIRYLAGSWQGRSSGQFGSGTIRRDYTFVLGGRYLRSQTSAKYEPQKPGQKPESHEDVGYFSYDTERKRLVFREFLSEGAVLTYTAEPATNGNLVFTTESVENNLAPGMRARVTFKRVSDGEMEETLELAPKGAAFQVYVKSRLKRTGASRLPRSSSVPLRGRAGLPPRHPTRTVPTALAGSPRRAPGSGA